MWDFFVKDDKEIQEILEVMDMVCKDRSFIFRKVHNVESDEKLKGYKALSKELNCDILELSKVVAKGDVAFMRVRDYRKQFLNFYSYQEWDYELFKEATRYIDFIFCILEMKLNSEINAKKHSFSDVILFIDEELKKNLNIKDIELLEYYFGLHYSYAYSIEEISRIKKISEYQIRKCIKKSVRILREEKEEFLNFFVIN